MTELGIVKRNVKRADRAAVDRLAQFGAATVHEAMGRVGLMNPYMRSIYARAQISGTAVTVLLQPGDNWMMHVVAEQIQPGDVGEDRGGEFGGAGDDVGGHALEVTADFVGHFFSLASVLSRASRRG